MRGLNSLKKERPDKKYWQDSQQEQIDAIDQKGLTLRAAFPGSFVFNHILILNVDAGVSCANLSVPDVSDIVYANCSNVNRDRSYENAVVIDADDINDLSIVDAITGIIDSKALTRVVVLGNTTHDTCGELLERRFDGNIAVDVVEPEWNNAEALHNIYRQATTVIFVNTMRALDAAYTGCSCLLITDEIFCKNPVFTVLHQQLVRVGCDVYDNSRQKMDIAGQHEALCLIVENSTSALDIALEQLNVLNDGKRANSDWLSGYKNLNTDLIIKSSNAGNRLSDLRDRKTGLNRKVAKLRDDPRAFFSDSNSAALRLIARTLWADSAQG